MSRHARAALAGLGLFVVSAVLLLAGGDVLAFVAFLVGLVLVLPWVQGLAPGRSRRGSYGDGGFGGGADHGGGDGGG